MHTTTVTGVPRDLKSIGYIVAGVFCMYVVMTLMSVLSSAFMQGEGWSGAIGWEAVLVLTALVCARLFPLGIRQVITWRTTLLGLKLELPEILFATYVLIQVLPYGAPNGIAGPLGMSLAVGTAEELLFRVIVLGWLVTRMDVVAALFISSAIFGLAHLHELSFLGIVSTIPQFAGGMVLGAVYLRTRNIIGPILAHAYWDFPYFLAYGAGISGGGTEAGLPPVSSTLLWTGFVIYALYLVRYQRSPQLASEPAPQPA